MTKLCGVDGCQRAHRVGGFCRMHYVRLKKHGAVGPAAPMRGQNGSGTIDKKGYRVLEVGGRTVKEHILVAERALGFRLPVGAVVHHVNEDRLDNRNQNLVVCQDRAYHALIHKRMRALEACGHADWSRCWVCGKYDAKENLYTLESGSCGAVHPECRTAYRRELRAKARVPA